MTSEPVPAGAAPRRKRANRPLPVIVGYGVVVGIAGGLGAWFFRLLIGLVHNLLFLGRFSASYDANVHTPPSPWGVAVILVPVLGALGVVYLVTHYAPEAKGHGVPEVMDAVHYQEGVIRPIVAVIKALASALSIGTGGSVGREGPIVQIGSAFGSSLGQVRRLSTPDLQLLIAAGSAAGIAATFNAPLGGVLFAVELLLVRVSGRALLVVAASVAAAITIARSLLGSQLAFTVLQLEQVKPLSASWVALLALAVTGAVVGVVSAMFIRGLYWSEDRFEQRFRNPYLAHVVGMATVGLAMYGFFRWLGDYSVQGVGYATITDVLRGIISNPWILLALAGGKWLVTVLTLGSGASGGVFSPSLFMGAAVGGIAGHVFAGLGLSVDPTVFALGGMAGTVAGTTGAVLTGIVVVTEMTGDFAAAVPLLVVAASANAVRRYLAPATIYTEKLLRRGRWVPTGLQSAGISTIRARDVMKPWVAGAPSVEGGVTIDPDATVFAVVTALETGKVVLVERDGTVLGTASRDLLDAAIARLGEGRLLPGRTGQEEEGSGR
jgi:CIC family chloride channel protein